MIVVKRCAKTDIQAGATAPCSGGDPPAAAAVPDAAAACSGGEAAATAIPDEVEGAAVGTGLVPEDRHVDDEASTVFGDASPLAEHEPGTNRVQGIRMVEDVDEDELEWLREHKSFFVAVKAMMPMK